ncbi:MAG: T9SS type A sorting domain-containing protein [Lentimicrobiaceae bacterium]|nr:T9SS type A sorting domain-containing protein [Lentimicrobiaceae bacterium]
MKKFLLSLVLMTFAGYMSAQTLFFEHEGQPVEPGTYYVIGDINDMMELQFELNVINGIADPINVTCQRVEIETSGMNYFCWGQCLAPNVSEGTVENMEPGMPTLFSAHFMPIDDMGNLVPGSELHVEYHFIERTTNVDYVFEVYFKYSLESVVDYNDVNVFSNAYPNPAKNTLSFNYNMPYDAQSSYIAIYNMMGQEVIREFINVGGSRLDINVSDLTEGVYFYSLIVDNNKVKTNKFVISR